MFNLVVSDTIQPETRRGILFSVATIYDPLGYAGLLLLPGRQINQELCRMKYEWDERLPEELVARWREWKNGLAGLNSFSIPQAFI